MPANGGVRAGIRSFNSGTLAFVLRHAQHTSTRQQQWAWPVCGLLYSAGWRAETPTTAACCAAHGGQGRPCLCARAAPHSPARLTQRLDGSAHTSVRAPGVAAPLHVRGSCPCGPVTRAAPAPSPLHPGQVSSLPSHGQARASRLRQLLPLRCPCIGRCRCRWASGGPLVPHGATTATLQAPPAPALRGARQACMLPAFHSATKLACSYEARGAHEYWALAQQGGPYGTK